MFEQQSQAGALYTSEDICSYIALNTIIPFIFDIIEKQFPAAFEAGGLFWQVLRDNPDRYIYETLRRGDHLPAETEREYTARRKRYAEIKSRLASGRVTFVNDCITFNLDLWQLAQDVIERCNEPELLQVINRSIEQVTVLDLCCGSGAFLLAALDVLETLGLGRPGPGRPQGSPL